MNKVYRKGFLLLVLIILSSCHRTEEITYYPNGQIHEVFNISTRDGKEIMVGPFISYYESGVVQSKGRLNHNSYMVGKWENYYSSGKIMSIVIYDWRGKMKSLNAWDQDGNQAVIDGTGTLELYYPDGSIMSRISYKDNHFDGASEGWYSNGQKEHEYFFFSQKSDIYFYF